MTDNTELKRLVDRVLTDRRFCGDENHKALADGVRALIAENEELGRYLCTCRDCGGEGALHTGDWHSCGHMEPPEPVMEKCGECDGTGLLGEIQDLYQVITDRDQLRAEVAGLKTGYEAYERVNAELKAENDRIERNRDMWKGQVERQSEELAALRGEVTEWKDTVKFNEKCWSEERGTMIDKLQESRMRIKELDLLFGRYILAMRSALIEEEHGKGPAAAMEWIYNSLAGPGELPPEGETDSQAYFDREIVAVDNGMQEVISLHEGRRAALGQGEQP